MYKKSKLTVVNHKAKIIRVTDTRNKVVGPMRIKEYLLNSDYSAAVIKLSGKHGKIKSLTEDRIYFILVGRGFFWLNDKKQAIAAGELIFVPKNTIYDLEGKMEYLMISSPEFAAENDRFLD